MRYYVTFNGTGADIETKIGFKITEEDTLIYIRDVISYLEKDSVVFCFDKVQIDIHKAPAEITSGYIHFASILSYSYIY